MDDQKAVARKAALGGGADPASQPTAARIFYPDALPRGCQFRVRNRLRVDWRVACLRVFGIDILLLYVGFRLNYRDGRMREILRLVGDDFVVEKIGWRGDARQWRFQAFWLKLQVAESSADTVRLVVSSHGRKMTICGFLNAEETRAIAAELRLALERWRERISE